MSVPASNDNGGGLYRLTPEQTQELLDKHGAPMFTVVDANGQPTGATVGLRILEPEPVKPAPISLPVKTTAVELGIRADGEATQYGIQLDYQQRRRGLEHQLAGELGTLGFCRFCVAEAQADYKEAKAALEAFVDGLPRRLRRRLGRRPSRLAKAVPWTMWAADTMFLSRAYGLFGALPLPFSASVYVTNATQVLRAAAVSFGLVFGARLVGGKLRELAEELRDRWPLVGIVFDAGVGGLVLAGAVRLASSTAQLQQALLQIEAGGTSVHVPTSVLFSIVLFLASVSFAAGYYLAEPELEQAAEHDQQVSTTKNTLREAVRAVYEQLGIVRGIRKQLASVPEEETYELAETAAHSEQKVYAHKAGNPLVYGLEMTAAGTTGAPAAS